MNTVPLLAERPPLPQIDPVSLVVGLLPVVAVVLVSWRWSLDVRGTIVAGLRMVVQLLLIGFVLAAVFTTNQPEVVGGMLLAMLVAAACMAPRTVPRAKRRHYACALAGIAGGGLVTLVFVTQVVVRADPWFAPWIVLPLGGMVFANAMNGISLAAERYESEFAGGESDREARRIGLRTALIPTTNSFVAAGLVALPGMMTGQILAGVDPLVAVRYQIVVMSTVFGSTGLASAVYLTLLPAPPATTDPADTVDDGSENDAHG